MNKTILYAGVLSILVPAFAGPLQAAGAGATITAAATAQVPKTSPAAPESPAGKDIMKLLQLPIKEQQGSCLRSVIDQDFTGKEMFAVEKCPFVKSAELKVLPDIEQTGSSKGRLRIDIACTIKNNDYYAGKLKKSFDKDAQATITAEYIYALEDLSLKNLSVQGDPFCAQPIKVQIKKYQ